jgi:adenylate kinase
MRRDGKNKSKAATEREGGGRYRAILLFGAPGSGKGTQGKILGTIPNYFHCACGDVFRGLSAQSEIGRTFLEYSSRGQLVPDEPTIALWRQYIDGMTTAGHFRPEDDTLVLDGIPRNASQAEMLEDTLDVRAIIYLDCPQMNKLVERLQRRALRENRLDDASLKVIRHRLKTYERETKPVLKHYGKSLVHRVDSTQSPTAVLYDILGRIKGL